MIAGRNWDIPDWFGWLSAFGGTVAATFAAVGGPETHLTAIGGFYGYVAAYTFLFFPLRWAILQWMLSGIAFGLALSGSSTPGHGASWVIVMGISAGGAGLIGSVGGHLRKRWDAERRTAQREQELASMRATFLQAVSHELRTPLTSVLGFAKTLEQHGDRLDAETTAALHERTRVQAERLHGLLDDLLDLDRLQRQGTVANREPVHLREVIVNAIGQVPHPDHAMTLGQTPDELVNVEPALVERVVVNLLSNAVRYTPLGCSIGVDASLASDGLLTIRVHDDGPGLPETADDLFDPFVQGPGAAERSNPGTGIGLSLVRHMARIHGGTVQTERTPGGGATFVVNLPDSAAPSPDAPSSGQGPPSVVPGPARSGAVSE